MTGLIEVGLQVESFARVPQDKSLPTLGDSGEQCQINPQPGAIGSDYGRFGLPFWEDVYAVHAHNRRRARLLEELMRWRNGIAHNDFPPDIFGPNPVLQLSQVRRWRSALNSLCHGFDQVMRNRLTEALGTAPWPR